MAEAWAEALQGSSAIALLESEDLQGGLTPERRVEVQELVASYKAGPQKEVLLRAMISDSPDVHLFLRKMRWRFLVPGGASLFLTGDNPVFTSGLGLRKLPAELTFPIASDVYLHASWQTGPEGFIDVPEKYTRELNHRAVSRSREAFHCHAEAWVTTILNKDDHPIFLLDVTGTLPFLWQHRDRDIPQAWLE